MFEIKIVSHRKSMLPPPEPTTTKPREFWQEPEVNLSPTTGHQMEQVTQTGASKQAQVERHHEQLQMGAKLERRARKEWTPAAFGACERQQLDEDTCNKNRITGDSWIMSSDRIGGSSIFLKPIDGTETAATKLELEANHKNQSLSPVKQQSSKMQQPATPKHSKDLARDLVRCRHSHSLHHEPLSTSAAAATTIFGRLKQQSSIWTRQAPISKFISLSATSVCLLSTSTKLLLQLVLIMMLIMIPLSVVKCPNVVVVAMAARQPQQQHQHQQQHHQSPSAPIAALATTKDGTKLGGSTQAPPTPYERPPRSSPLAAATTTTKDIGGGKLKVSKLGSEQQFQQQKQTFSPITTTGHHRQQQQQQATPANAGHPPQYVARADEDTAPASGGRANRKRAKRSPAATHEEPSVGCQQLARFWSSFRGSYPSLAGHLFSLASSMGEEHLVAETSKTIGRLLEEAERMLRDQQVAARGLEAQRAPLTVRPATKASSAWLARVMAKPLYNRIIQHFQNQHKQLADRHQNLHDSMGKPAAVWSPPDGGGSRQADQSLAADGNSHVYGRVVHYPHEAANNEASSGPLDRLKQLNQQQLDEDNGAELTATAAGQQRQPQQTVNEIDRPIGQMGGDDIESNRIPLLAGDGEPWPTAGGRHHSQGAAKLDSDDANSARNKYVYGDVLLRPSQKMNAQRNSQTNHDQQHRHSSLGALRQLSNDLDRSMRLETDRQPQTAPAEDDMKLTQQQQQRNEPASESYGRVLVSPPERTSGLGWNGKDGGSGKDKSRGQLDVSGSGSDAVSRGLNELAAQHYGGSVAAIAPDEPANEFEGVWYSGPLQQIEVRQLRSGDSGDRTKGVGDNETEVVVHTTSSSKQVIVVD